MFSNILNSFVFVKKHASPMVIGIESSGLRDGDFVVVEQTVQKPRIEGGEPNIEEVRMISGEPDEEIVVTGGEPAFTFADEITVVGEPGNPIINPNPEGVPM